MLIELIVVWGYETNVLSSMSLNTVGEEMLNNTDTLEFTLIMT